MHRPRDPIDRCTQLLLRAQEGDSEAFAELQAALVPVVRDFIASLDGELPPNDVDDLVQETMLLLWQKLPEYRGEASAKTFVLAIAKNITLKHMSGRQRLPVIYVGDLSGILGERELCDQPGSLPAEPSETQAKIRQALGQLTDVQRQAIELDLLRGLPRPESLKLAECTPNQFQKRLQRAMKTLRRLLRDLPRCLFL